MRKTCRQMLSKMWKDERGSQIIEFIFIFPLIWLLMMFSFDQFSIMYNKQKALAAAYEAGRSAAVQPNYGLADYYAQQLGQAELRQGIGLTGSAITLNPQGSWRKGNHVEAEARISFTLLTTGKRHTITERYVVMIENAEEKQ
ncbi:TadE/TadG family type IV pilus assembly protein [Brevibacillus sp. TJ4]|uniref:TadE/TadG family type IV pilus assembly protein n=1 Tax=Brevibacillus sp. TJ4 TaxID=3234853 RepID=UPI0037D2CF76